MAGHVRGGPENLCARDLLPVPHTGCLKLGELSFACAVLPGGVQVLARDDVARALGLDAGAAGAAWAVQAGQWMGSSAVRYRPAKGAAPAYGIELSRLIAACRL